MNKNDVRVILVMGKSGSGKQPRIDALAEEFGFQQLSTGNIFRAAISMFQSIKFSLPVSSLFDEATHELKTNDEIKSILKSNCENAEPFNEEDTADVVVLGAKAKYYIESGLFAPDSLTNEIFGHTFKRYFDKSVHGAPARKGLVLDGFPRTPDQVEYLVELVRRKNFRIDFVLEVDLDDEMIVKRTMGRRICPTCAKVFHLLFSPPRDGTHCTSCENVEVIKRTDDSQEELLRKRLQEYQEKVVPAINVLDTKYRVLHVKCNGHLDDPSKEAVKNDVLKTIAPLFGTAAYISKTTSPTGSALSNKDFAEDNSMSVHDLVSLYSAKKTK